MTLKICLTVVITLLVVAIIAVFFTGNFFYNLAINPNASKKMIFSNDGLSHHELTKEEEWLEKESKFEEVFTTSFDNLKLHGYQVLNKDTHKWAVTVHGYMADAFSLSTKALHYYNIGYNVLAMDLRGHGKSKGNYIGMGYHDAKDLIKWIEYIISKDEEAEILIHGVSMGAATVMIASSLDELPKNVKVIIEDCGYTTALEQFKFQLKKLFNMPSFPILNIANLAVKIKAGYFLNEASPIEAVQKAKVPIMFIHGDGDKFVPFYMLDDLYNTCTSEKKKLVIEGASHAHAEDENPDKYWGEIDEFVNRYM
ncbi:MAG: alpha/beta hydrolase [Intestinibacter bartlettii]|uniref:alpha/beta hydrolase n=1 Tax=Intestinibacter bartlettii TaxID=261299 RepID=UPI0026ED3118|nr:alpha/beta hydrolase [Intestinibacter bartlettii]MDO5009723.1 alpha/beta hydrolase [Intestinibacter bartlettii]